MFLARMGKRLKGISTRPTTETERLKNNGQLCSATAHRQLEKLLRSCFVKRYSTFLCLLTFLMRSYLFQRNSLGITDVGIIVFSISQLYKYLIWFLFVELNEKRGSSG